MIFSRLIKPFFKQTIKTKRYFSTFHIDNPNTRQKRFDSAALNIALIGGVLYVIFDE